MIVKNLSVYHSIKETYLKKLSGELPNTPHNGDLFNTPELLFYAEHKILYKYTIQGRSVEVTYDSLQEYIAKDLVVTHSFNRVNIYEYIVEYLYHLAHQCIYGREYLKYICKLKALNLYSYEGTIFDNPDKYFVVINDVLCFVKYSNDKHQSKLYLPVTAENFNRNLLYEFPSMTDTLKKRIVKMLKKEAEKLTFPEDNKGFFTGTFCNVFYRENGFCLKPNMGNIRSKNHDAIPTAPLLMANEKIAIHESTYKFFDNIFDCIKTAETPNSFEAFVSLAKIVAAAYITSYKYNTATIIQTNNANHDNIIYLIHAIFGSEFLYLHPNDYNREKFHETLHFQSYFNNTKLLLLFADKYVLTQYEGLRNLVQGNTQEIKDPIAGKIKYKSRRPVVIITNNEKTAQKLSKQFRKSKILKFDTTLDIVFQYFQNPERMFNVRLVLLLLGMKLLSDNQNHPATPKLKELSDENIESKFIEAYCSKSENDFVSKAILKNAFNKFTEKCYPQYKGKSIRICHRLLELEGTESAKKRIVKGTNPVAVIKGVYFDSLRFESSMKEIDNLENKTAPKEKVQEKPKRIMKMLEELSQCEVKTVDDIDVSL